MNREESVPVTLGRWQLDVDAHRLISGDEEHLLDPKDLSVLMHLIDSAPTLVSTDELLDRTWPDTVVGDNALQQVIARLRRILGDDARDPRFIETLPRRGYRLLVTPERSTQTGGQVKTATRIRASAWALFFGIAVVGSYLIGFESNSTEPVIAVVGLDGKNLTEADLLLVSAFTSEVTNRLEKIAGVRVISPFVLNQVLKGDDGDVQRLVSLGANRVVSGEAVMVEGKLILRIDATDLERGQLVKSLRYQMNRDEFFALQQEVALAVADVFDVAWTPEDRSRIAKVSTENINAVSLKAQASRLIGIPGATDVAIGLLEDAVEADPNYTDAVGMLSWAHKWRANLGHPESWSHARLFAEQAMAQDSDNGWARFAMGHVHVRDGEIAEAIRHFRAGARALPNLTSQVDDLSAFLVFTGELVEGLYWGIEAYRLWPSNPNSRHHLALPLIYLDERERAQTLLEASTTHALGRTFRSLTHLALLEADMERARSHLQNMPTLPPHPEKDNVRAIVHLIAGEPLQAAEVLRQTVRNYPDYGGSRFAGDPRMLLAFSLLQGDPAKASEAHELLRVAKLQYEQAARDGSEWPHTYLNLAAMHSILGQREQALVFLERAYEHGYRLSRFLEIDPLFSAIREDPRFGDLLERMRTEVALMRARATSEGLQRLVDLELREIAGA